MDRFNLMTEKMRELLLDIVAAMRKFPKEQIGYIFGYEEEGVDMELIRDVACVITLEFIKYSYDVKDPEYSLRHFFSDVNDDSNRVLRSRTMKYVLQHKLDEIKRKGGDADTVRKYTDIDMSSIENRLKGYNITEMNNYEHQNIIRLELIKGITERRIVSTKSISNNRFREMFSEYDSEIVSLQNRSLLSDEDMVFASLAFFTLEWRYPIELFYSLACLMEEEGTKTIDSEKLIMLCSFVRFISRSGCHISIESRMVKERLKYAYILFSKEEPKFISDETVEWIQEILTLVAEYTERMVDDTGKPYKEWFRQESTIKDWASFFRYYDLFSIWEKKEWTNARIRNMRYLFDQVLLPKN